MADPLLLPDWPRGMREEVAAAYVGISPSLLRAEAREGRFPAGVRVTAGRVVWLREDLDRWLDQKAGRNKAFAEAAGPGAPSDWDLEFGDHRAA